MARIFISYKRVDKDKVFKIKDQIEVALGEKCWIDIDGIESNAQFINVIVKAIRECEVVLFMYSKTHAQITNFEKDWTIRELNYASKKNKRIVFVNIDGSPLSDEFEFLYGTQQQVDATSAQALFRLNKDLKTWLGKNNTELRINDRSIKTNEKIVYQIFDNIELVMTKIKDENIYVGNLQVKKLEGTICNLCEDSITDATTYKVLSCLLGEDPIHFYQRTYSFDGLSDFTIEDEWKIRSERQALLKDKLYHIIVKNLSQQFKVPLLHATSIEKKKYRIYGDYPVILNLNTEIKKDSMNNLQSLLKAD